MKYVIGDIHCEYIKLKKLLKIIKNKDSEAEFYSVGDIVNRKYGLKRILFLINKYEIKVVRGNNEQQYLDNYYDLVIDMLENKYLTVEYWLQEKVISVLLEYKLIKKDKDKFLFIKNMETLKDFHVLLQYLHNLPIEITLEDKNIQINGFNKVIITHSGIGNIYNKYKKDQHNPKHHKIIMENRDKKYTKHKFFNVFGHTPITKNIVILNKKDTYINIDTGACYSNHTNKNPLTAISLYNGELYDEY